MRAIFVCHFSFFSANGAFLTMKKQVSGKKSGRVKVYVVFLGRLIVNLRITKGSHA